MGKRGPKKGQGGRPQKPLREKLIEGNPGKRDIKVLDETVKVEVFDFKPPKALKSNKNAKKIYDETVEWLKKTGCIGFIPPYRIASYAICVARWVECEEENNEALLAPHPTTGQPMQSPLVDIALKYNKRAAETWDSIMTIVKENSTVDYMPGAPTLDAMEELLIGGNPIGGDDS